MHDSVCYPFLALHPLGIRRSAFYIAQMRRQDQKSFDQREQQRQRDYHRELPGKLRCDARQEQPRGKCDDRRKHGKYDRATHSESAGNRRLLASQPTLVDMMMNALSHHDRVVDHNAQNEQEGKCRQQIQ